MKLIRLDSPASYKGGEWEPMDFNEYDLKALNAVQPPVELAIYWYSRGCYCGAGNLLVKSERGWGLHDCGHCSCYGPLSGGFSERGPGFSWHRNLESIQEVCSSELWRREEIMRLVERAWSERALNWEVQHDR